MKLFGENTPTDPDEFVTWAFKQRGVSQLVADRIRAAEARAAQAEAERDAILERERVELIEWAARVDEQFKMRQQAEAERDEAKQQATTVAKWLANATKERDEARRQLKQCKEKTS